MPDAVTETKGNVRLKMALTGICMDTGHYFFFGPSH